ncbi:ABC transporter substrate-binding protein [Candidatus Riflebacteria bacterium]
MRRMLLFGGIVLSSFFLFACFERDDGRTEDGRIKVVFWHAMVGKLALPLEQLIKKFNQTHPKIFVKGVSMGNYETLTKKLLASIIARTYPDISQNFEPLTRMFMQANKIIPLDSFLIEDGELDPFKKDLVPALLANNTYDGKLWSMPFNKSLSVIYYNKEHFRLAGLNPDKPPATWKEFKIYAQRLDGFQKKRDAEFYGTGATKRSAWLLESMIFQQGGKLIDKDKKKTLFDSKETLDSLLFLHDLRCNGLLRVTKGYDFQSDFVTQKNSMIIASIVSRAFMESKISFNFGVAPLPYFKKPASVLSGTNLNIFKRTDKKRMRATWEFLKWFTGSEQTAYWSIHTTYMPVRRSAINGRLMQTEFKQDNNTKAAIMQLDYATQEPRITEWFEIRQILDTMVENILSLEIKDPQKVKDIIRRANIETTVILRDS